MRIRDRGLLAVLALLAAAGPARAQTERQDPALVRQSVEQFLQVQTADLPGEVQLKIGAIDPRTVLPACAALQPFLPAGGRAWGRTSVGVRCSAPSPWTIYVTATVKVVGEYVATAAPLIQGKAVGPSDIIKLKGDLTALPAGIVTDPEQAIGRTAAVSLAAGAPLRSDALRGVQAVQQGQSVRVVTNGPGFAISTEARALNNAAEGQIAQARTNSGQVVSGVARAGGVVEVTY